MATAKKLDCVILGLLSHEELTGYEIKKRMDSVLHYFWGASYGSIYPTLRELCEKGLATVRGCVQSGREKRVYTITAAGREYLNLWLRLPVQKDEIRYETLLKLFFGEAGGPRQAIAHIDAFERKTKQELSYLLAAKKTLMGCLDDAPAHRYYLLTVQFGIETYRAYLRWCQQARAVLQQADKKE